MGLPLPGAGGEFVDPAQAQYGGGDSGTGSGSNGAAVTFDTQTVQNGSTSVNVDTATFTGTEPFNIVVHQATDSDDDGEIEAANGEIGTKIGESAELETGDETSTDVDVNISKQIGDDDDVSQLTANQTLVAMLHTTNTSDGDEIVHTAPITQDGTPVFNRGEITVEADSNSNSNSPASSKRDTSEDTAGAPSGGIRDGTGALIQSEDLEVSVERLNTTSGEFVQIRAPRSAPSGQYNFDNLDPGEDYRVRATFRGETGFATITDLNPGTNTRDIVIDTTQQQSIVDEYDADGNGEISISELGQAGQAFASGELTITELGEVGAAFAS